jgi:CO/xanthine dehydrogenase FAD-binding subunit
MGIDEYVTPESIEDAVGLLDGDGTFLWAGGTTLMPRVTASDLRARRAVGLRRAGLDYVEARGDGAVAIGAMTRLGGLASTVPAPIGQAASSVGAWALRTLATIGGNLFAAVPYGDVAVALLALDARVSVTGADGDRELSIADAIRGLREREVVRELVIPAGPGRRTGFVKQGRRALASPAVVTVAVALTVEDGRVTTARVALGGAGQRPLRSTPAEERIAGSDADSAARADAANAAAAMADPPSDEIASGWYRKRMIALHVRDAVYQAVEDGDD